MKIAKIQAHWIRCPIPEEKQHVSDFGRIQSFDMALVSVEVEDGMIGWGEAKASVGSAANCQALVSIIGNELGPELIGMDARQINAIWDRQYSGTRAGYALDRGRAFPILGRRGPTISAIGAIDMALWDLRGKALGVPVVELWGGARQSELPAYASGGWADAEGIGDQLNGYVQHGFGAVKMRVGIMDGSVQNSIARVRAAREGIGPDIGLMVDAHGTFTAQEAIQFANGVEDVGLRWFEEPVSADDRRGAKRVRQMTGVPISAGESEFTRFDFRDLIELDSVDILQPDLAICGGPSEGRKIAALAETYQLELAPHCWGSALSFSAGVHLAFSSSAGRVIEYSLGGNPLLHELAEESFPAPGGKVIAPTAVGFGVTPKQSFIDQYEVKM